MIAVIADDFSGAAELAGISLRYGLRVELTVGQVYASNADVIIVSTDSRSMGLDDAKLVTTKVINSLLPLRPEFIFKKIDSVLRGHVLEEIKLQMHACALKKVLIIPANPSLGRTIIDGNSFIEGKNVSTTAFAHDPEFPISHDDVTKILGGEASMSLKFTDELPQCGIVVGDAASEADIRGWVSRIDGQWMKAGAGDFYSAILASSLSATPQTLSMVHRPHLYVCGTALHERKGFVSKVRETLNCVSYVPQDIEAEWVRATCAILEAQQRAIIAFDNHNGDASTLRVEMARAVGEIIKQTAVEEIFIEGGSTAAAVIKELNIYNLRPVSELKRGVVQMKAGNLFITVKPGSYELPNEILDLYS